METGDKYLKFIPVIPKQGTYNLMRYKKCYDTSKEGRKERFLQARFIGFLPWVCLLGSKDVYLEG